MDLCELVAFHKRKGATATLTLVRVEDISGYGVVELDAKKNILGSQEKPDPNEAVSNVANTASTFWSPRSWRSTSPRTRCSTSPRTSSPRCLPLAKSSWGMRATSTGRI